MPPRRRSRHHLQHSWEELVLRSTHDAAVRAAFAVGERLGRLDGIAAERERALRIMFVADELKLVPLARILLGEEIEVTKALGILRVAAGLPPQDPADTAFDEPLGRAAPG